MTPMKVGKASPKEQQMQMGDAWHGGKWKTLETATLELIRKKA